MENKKLSQEELEQIQQIQQQMQLAQTEFGKLEMQKVEIVNFVGQVRQAETALVKALEEKYGQGSIDLQKGEFIPTEKVEQPTVKTTQE